MLFPQNLRLKTFFFQENSSDAIDIDFSDGQIENIKLKIIGNDGIDISGSKVNLQKIDLSNIGDKSLSVGESANVKITDVTSKK